LGGSAAQLHDQRTLDLVRIAGASRQALDHARKAVDQRQMQRSRAVEDTPRTSNVRYSAESGRRCMKVIARMAAADRAPGDRHPGPRGRRLVGDIGLVGTAIPGGVEVTGRAGTTAEFRLQDAARLRGHRGRAPRRRRYAGDFERRMAMNSRIQAGWSGQARAETICPSITAAPSTNSAPATVTSGASAG
jgi:hypothetical protein